MSIHYQLMLQRYGIGQAFSLPTAVNHDPIFTPIFTAIMSSSVVGLSGTALATAVSIANALTVTSFAGGVQYLDRD